MSSASLIHSDTARLLAVGVQQRNSAEAAACGGRMSREVLEINHREYTATCILVNSGHSTGTSGGWKLIAAFTERISEFMEFIRHLHLRNYKRNLTNLSTDALDLHTNS